MRLNTPRSGTSLLEVVWALALMVIIGVPLMGALQTTTRSVGVSRDYLIAQNVAQMLYEYAAFYGNTDDSGSFDSISDFLEVPDYVMSPYTGCKGMPVSDLATAADDVLMPDDGDMRFNFYGDNAHFVNLFNKYSYTLHITKSESDSVVSTNSGGTLYRIDIDVYWKGIDRRERRYSYSNYLAKRKY